MTAIPQSNTGANKVSAAKPKVADTPPKAGRGHASKRVRNSHRAARFAGTTQLSLRAYVAKTLKTRAEGSPLQAEAVAWLDSKA